MDSIHTIKNYFIKIKRLYSLHTRFIISIHFVNFYSLIFFNLFNVTMKNKKRCGHNTVQNENKQNWELGQAVPWAQGLRD